MNQERFEELKEAFALGAVPEEERKEFEDYLAHHPERQAEIEELGTLAGLLALSPEEHDPSPDLGRRIMEAVGAEAVRPPASRRFWLTRVREFLGVRGLALGAAAAMLVIGLLSWNLILQGEIQDPQGRLQRLQDQPQEPQMVALKGSGVANEARAEVIILNKEQAVLMAENMSPLPEDKTCQIWVIEDDVPKPAGLFEPRQDTVAAVVEHPLSGGDVIAVTVEPEGGSPKPTTDPMLTAKL